VRPKGERRTRSAACKKSKLPHFVPRSKEPERWSAGLGLGAAGLYTALVAVAYWQTVA
jgi:hypothetical protein